MNDPDTTDGWHPRHPDPALAHPLPPGLRPHRHPPNRLHIWVFDQHQVWVDAFGSEWETDVLPPEYARNIIGFCQHQAARIKALVTIDRFAEATRLWGEGNDDDANALAAQIAADTTLTPEEFLERTPLFRALRRTLEQRPKESR